MTKPHKYADVIKAWADGKQVQWAHPVAPSITDPLGQREPVWGEWSWHLWGIPSFDEIYLWRVKPDHKWQAEMDAFARGETIQYRDADPMVYSRFGCQDWTDFGLNTRAHPTWATTSTREYRIKPKTVTVRVRPAMMVSEKSIDPVWVRLAKSTELANELERSPHFRCWASDWIEVWMSDEDRLTAGNLNASRLSGTIAKISEGSITTEKTPFGALHAMGVDAAKPGSDRTVVWCYDAPPRNPELNVRPHFYRGIR